MEGSPSACRHRDRVRVGDRDFDEALGGADLLNHGDLPGDGRVRERTEPSASRRRFDGLRAACSASPGPRPESTGAEF